MEINLIKSVIEKLLSKKDVANKYSAILGFDGFIDYILRPIKQGNSLMVDQYFEKISDLGEYLIEHSNRSCSIELKEFSSKIGGNTAILGNALSEFGLNVTCIGTYGYPDIHPLFSDLDSKCNLISLDNPGVSLAFEFLDGKVMFAMNRGINNLSWELIEERVDINELINYYNNSHIICLLNWGELPFSNNIWTNLYNNVLKKIKSNKNIFIDFSNFNRKSKNQVIKITHLISELSKNFNVTLSLNENELTYLCKALDIDNNQEVEKIALGILDILKIDKLIFHFYKNCMAITKDYFYSFDNLVIDNPKITTGGGDNFNAGYCAALLLGFDLFECLIIASLTASFYVKNGFSATIDDLTSFMADQLFL